MNPNLIFVNVFNYGVIEMAKNHLKSLHQNGHTNTLSFVTDKESADALAGLGYNHVLVSQTNISSENKNFGTTEFNQMSYLRYYCIQKYLEQNANTDVWYMDVDTVVTNNLNQVYLDAKRNNKDVYFQSDINMMCTGCMLLFASSNTKNFLNAVFNNKIQETNDQILVRFLLNQYPHLINYGVFDCELFPCGVLYFGSDFVNPPEYIVPIKQEVQMKMQTRPPMFVHANWMIGDDTKTAALKKYGLWFV
jgi:hypothetical protein